MVISGFTKINPFFVKDLNQAVKVGKVHHFADDKNLLQLVTQKKKKFMIQ